jgi:hypothetical protein
MGERERLKNSDQYLYCFFGGNFGGVGITGKQVTINYRK